MKMTKENCFGCEQDFYNGNNPLGVKECWHFQTANIISRKKVGLWQNPPWTQKAGKYPSCYQQKGYVFVKPDQEY